VAKGGGGEGGGTAGVGICTFCTVVANKRVWGDGWGGEYSGGLGGRVRGARERWGHWEEREVSEGVVRRELGRG